MDIDIYKTTIRNEFSFAKSATSFAELLNRSIELPAGGCLVPLSYLHVDNDELIEKLSSWREAASDAYPTRFQVTCEGTRRWMKEAVLDKEDRLLFLIYEHSGRIVGHAGFANALNEQRILELDNILRGESSVRRGIMSESVLALENWGRTVLFAEGFYLRVLASNLKAIEFYKRLRYVEESRILLTWSREEGTQKLVPATASHSVDDEFIRMVPSRDDTVGRTLILTAGPSIGPREQVYVADAVRKGWNRQWNKYLRKFEDEFSRYVGTRYAIATSSCTGALHIALQAIGIGPGDEVIVPDLTWVATANAVRYVGATPVFADVDGETWCIDISSAESVITPHTKAVIPVHLYGHPCDMDAVMRFADHNKLFVVEDAAPSIGAEYRGRRTGSFGHFAAFSFQGAKLAVTGEGGMLVTSDEALYKRAYTICDQGRKPGTFWIEAHGLKYKMANLQAAIGLAQLQRNDAMVEAKRRIFSWYHKNLASIWGIRLLTEASWARSIYWMTSIIVTEDARVSRDEMMKQLKERNVDTRPVFPAISQYPIWPTKQEPKPTSKYIGERGMNLPSGVCLSRAEVDYVCEQIIDILM